MKIPEPRKVSSGKWFIQLRLGGESISISNWDKSACIKEARAVKAEYLAGKRVGAGSREAPPAPTLTEAIDAYISQRSNTLLPSYHPGVQNGTETPFPATMGRRIDQIAPEEWQGIVNQEAALCAPKTLKNAFNFIRGVILAATGRKLRR